MKLTFRVQYNPSKRFCENSGHVSNSIKNLVCLLVTTIWLTRKRYIFFTFFDATKTIDMGTTLCQATFPIIYAFIQTRPCGKVINSGQKYL
jgi:hypothetical protein